MSFERAVRLVKSTENKKSLLHFSCSLEKQKGEKEKPKVITEESPSHRPQHS